MTVEITLSENLLKYYIRLGLSSCNSVQNLGCWVRILSPWSTSLWQGSNYLTPVRLSRVLFHPYLLSGGLAHSCWVPVVSAPAVVRPQSIHMRYPTLWNPQWKIAHCRSRCDCEIEGLIYIYICISTLRERPTDIYIYKCKYWPIEHIRKRFKFTISLYHLYVISRFY